MSFKNVGNSSHHFPGQGNINLKMEEVITTTHGIDAVNLVFSYQELVRQAAWNPELAPKAPIVPVIEYGDYSLSGKWSPH